VSLNFSIRLIPTHELTALLTNTPSAPTSTKNPLATTCDTSPSTTSPRKGCHTTARYEIVYMAMPVPGITLGSLISRIPMIRTIIMVPVLVPSFFL
jgi:hypothetical protein